MTKKSFLLDDSEQKKAQAQSTDGKTVIPVVREELDIGKRKVDTGTTRVKRVVSEREETVEMPLLHEEAQVERVPVNAVLDAPAAIRQEGDVTVVPVMEEVLVVEKKLLLREELHIKKQRTTVNTPQTETLRSEDVIVERMPERRDNKR